MIIVALAADKPSPSWSSLLFFRHYNSNFSERTRRRVTVEPETNLFAALFDSADSPWWAPSASPLRERWWTTCRSRSPRHRSGCSHWGEPAGCSCSRGKASASLAVRLRSLRSRSGYSRWFGNSEAAAAGASPEVCLLLPEAKKNVAPPAVWE